MAKKDMINDKTYVRVDKNMVGSLSYDFDGRSKYWQSDSMYKNLEAREIQEIMSSTYGRNLFENDMLLIKNEEHRAYFGLETLDPQLLTYDDIKELLKKADDKDVEEKISTCTDNELELFIEVAKEVKLQDRNCIKVIEDYSDKELHEDLMDIAKAKDVKVEKQTEKQTRKPRQPKKQ